MSEDDWVYKHLIEYRTRVCLVLAHGFRVMCLEHALRIATTQQPECGHPDGCAEYIAQKEYPGGGVLWCSRCGAWRDDDECSWHLPSGR